MLLVENFTCIFDIYTGDAFASRGEPVTYNIQHMGFRQNRNPYDICTMTCIQRCQIWLETAMARNKRTMREHERVMYELYLQLKWKGIHTLTIAQRMDIAHYCTPTLPISQILINDRRDMSCLPPSTSGFIKDCISAFNYQSAIFRYKATPFVQGINFLTPHISPIQKRALKRDILPFFTMLNSTIELETEPLHLLSLGRDCLNVIGKMVVNDNRKRWRDWSYKYYTRVKEKYGFATDWSLFVEQDYTRMSDKHPYNIPMKIRNYCVAWGYRTEVVVVGKRWLDIWQACDALIRNTLDKYGHHDHHRFIERLVRPRHKTFEQYDIGEFLREDDPENNGNDGEYDENIWYLINGS